MSRMIRPAHLVQGDVIGIVAPASPVEREVLERSFQFLERLGLRYKVGQSVYKKNGYLAGTDEERLADLHEMFKDPEVKGILCAGGGYGSARYAEQLDLDLIHDHPKVFWGFSDITYLHTAIRQGAGLVTFHGPMLASCVAQDEFHEMSGKMFGQLFTPVEVHYSEAISPLETIVGGVAEGEVVGGNLTQLVNSLGSEFEVKTNNRLLVLEDVGEEPYKVDRLLNQLRLAGKLREAAGIVIGDFAKATPTKPNASLALDEVFEHYFGKLNQPVVKGFRIGHCEPNIAIPFGVKGRLDANSKTLTILPGVE
ncbi:LD-carboxypeptidase [Sporosarcina sp. P12(2017)]|uniref:S66 peptidase family protein n=1 Tax=unclassified Sporosarcina TaxID=2647733 RepID=UPI000C16407C|nr:MULTISPECIES: LD-carboxypeptidase [unclassified Sporosarcina]PIC58282.1 LD-carboxypeptidase [Sporosarcina sp. P10]PIC61745.1 LD-carboxypeptidase [Sporosarcina sp. P12(2017)]